MADHPLRPAIHRRLGAPLPHQLANGPQAHLRTTPEGSFPWEPQFPGRIRYYPVFPQAIPNPKVDHLRVTHPCATLNRCKHRPTVRLACLKRAASVRSEPGSNSPSYTSLLPRRAEADFKLKVRASLSSHRKRFIRRRFHIN